jgi:hypothetical protein
MLVGTSAINDENRLFSWQILYPRFLELVHTIITYIPPVDKTLTLSIPSLA